MLIHGQVGWTFLGSSALPIFSLTMLGTGLGALSYGEIASARSPGAGVPGLARSFGDKGGMGSSTGRVPVLCEPPTLAAPIAAMQTTAEQAVCLPGGGGVATERESVVYRCVSEEATDLGRVPGFERLQEGQDVPSKSAVKQCSTGQAVRLSSDEDRSTGAAKGRVSVVYRYALEGATDPGRVPGSERLQGGQDVPPTIAAMQCSPGQAVCLPTDQDPPSGAVSVVYRSAPATRR